MNTFLQQTFHGDYSIGMWLANLVAGHHGFRRLHHQHALHSEPSPRPSSVAVRVRRLPLKTLQPSCPGEVPGWQVRNFYEQRRLYSLRLSRRAFYSRFLVYVFRTGLILLCVGSVIFTTIGFIRAERQIERTPHHGHANRPAYRRSLDAQHAMLTDTIANEVYASHYSSGRRAASSSARSPSCSLARCLQSSLAGPQARHQSLHPHRRDGPGAGHPVHRSELQPT